MNTTNLRRLLDEATPRPWVHEDGSYWIRDPAQPEYIGLVECHDSAMNAALIVELVNSADELLAENERLRAELELRKGEWEDYTERLQDALSSQTADNTRLKSLLADWKEFGKDVSAADCGGQDWLDGLRGRTKAALEQKP